MLFSTTRRMNKKDLYPKAFIGDIARAAPNKDYSRYRFSIHAFSKRESTNKQGMYYLWQ
ncbi:MAG: hypothetical protein ABN480_00100 [Dickeya sp.]|jgi:hypothetical protein